MGRRDRTPDGPAGKKLGALLKALRGGNRADALRHFTGLVKVYHSRAAALDAVRMADPKLRAVLDDMLEPERDDSSAPVR
jgi:hypothetical protein